MYYYFLNLQIHDFTDAFLKSSVLYLKIRKKLDASRLTHRPSQYRQ